MKKTGIIAVIFLTVVACTSEKKDPNELIRQSIQAHGQNHFVDAKLAFTFRDRRYTSRRRPDGYIYTRSWQQNDTTTITDVLVNSDDFIRLLNGDTVNVPDSMAVKYTASVNSVLYFTQLPFLLTDPAVNATFEGTNEIDQEIYDVLKVTFSASNGGEDFQDEYRFWFHQESHLMDYLAYNYETDGGGVRFRKAINRFSVDEDLLTQDYINYEVPVGTPLSEIPKWYEAGKLRELSRIINQDMSLIPIN